MLDMQRPAQKSCGGTPPSGMALSLPHCLRLLTTAAMRRTGCPQWRTNSTIRRNDDDFLAAILAQGMSHAGEQPAGLRATCDLESMPKRARVIAIDLSQLK